MSRRTVLVCVAAAAVVAGVAALSQPKQRDAAEERAPPPPPPAEGEGPGRPPEFPPVRSDEDRIVHWVSMMQMGADDDVALAVTRLRTAGAAGRRAVRDAASVALESNLALVQQALEYLATGPDAADAEFARRALAGRDAESALRAIRLLTSAESPLTAASVAAIGDAAQAGANEVRVAALKALASSGDDAAAERAILVLGSAPRGEMAAVVGALEGTKNAKLLAWTSGCFDADTDVATRLSAASVLVSGGDMSRVAWLRELAGAAPAGPLDHADLALAILAKARDDAALARIGATAADRLAGADARIAAIRRLASYPAARVRAFLVPAAAAEEGVDLGVTIEALDLLVRGGDADALATMSKHLREGVERQVHAAALVCGRLRRADMAPHLEAALKRESLDESVRALVLRALVLSGEVRSAETVVRAIAADRGAYDAQVSMAYNAGATLADASPTMRHELGVQTVRALSGELGELRGAGLVQALRTAGYCSGLESVPRLSERLGHADAEVRTNAALALGHIGGKDAERDLRAAWWRWKDVETRSSIEEAMERAHYAVPGAQR